MGATVEVKPMSESPRKKSFDWKLDFEVNLGETYETFFDGLEEKRLRATECPECSQTFFPPQPHCDECFVATEGWTDLDPEGVIESYTVTYSKFQNMPEPPYVTGVIRVGDSATCLLHFVDGIDYDEPEDLEAAVEKGMRVRPVWSESRSGDILDIEYFEPIG